MEKKFSKLRMQKTNTTCSIESNINRFPCTVERICARIDTSFDKGDVMTQREILELLWKIETDPILTDEEIEFIWNAIDTQGTPGTRKPYLEG